MRFLTPPTETETSCITFSCYNEQGEFYAENAEKATGYYVQVNIWSKGDSTTLTDQAKAAMLAAGFKRTYATDLYEPDTGFYHKVLRFVYVT